MISLVAPLVGAWIEIPKRLLGKIPKMVAPLVGAWIEMRIPGDFARRMIVAPLVGAWIEISTSTPPLQTDTGRSPRGSVD